MGTAEAEKRREEVADALSADWNGKRQTSVSAVPPRALPSGWRKEHWKTQQAIAADYAGVKAASKYEAVKALAAYEARLKGGEAA
ncbi:hypothetical protein QW131_15275 [Roseibium salinum]|nr:hypothetical protein [Roseibium salinum]